MSNVKEILSTSNQISKKVLFGVTMTQYNVNDVIQILKLHPITGFLMFLPKYTEPNL